MLRRALLSRAPVTARSIRRWSAATASQKRALNKQQIDGSSTLSTTSTPTTASGTPPSAGNGNLLAIGAAAVTVVGGAYYYFNIYSKSPSPPPTEAEVQQPPVVAETIPKPAVDAPSVDGNRVTSIVLPEGTRSASLNLQSVAPTAHPEDGNRVIMTVAKAAASLTDSLMAEKAIAELKVTQTEEAAESLLRSHQSLWSAMDDTFVRDLDELNMAQVKARVVQLLTEMKDRTKWEAIRLKEFLAMKEKETSDKYMEILQKQRLEFEDLLAKRLREQEHALSQQMYQALHEKESTIQNVLNTALEAQRTEHEADLKAFEDVTTEEIRSKLQAEYNNSVQEYKEKMAQELRQKVKKIDKLTTKLKKLEAALEASTTQKQGSLRAHRLSAAALALAEKLETNQGASLELKALKDAAGSDGVIATALAAVPSAIEHGVTTLPELQSRFETIYRKARQASLVPAGRLGLEGQLAGMLFATLKYPPSPDDAAPENDQDNAEYVLSRAREHVKLGELDKAVEQLEKLQGQAAFTVQDWKKQAMSRISVEKALKVIRMECALVNESMVDE